MQAMSEAAELLEEALQRIVQWSEAYPLDIFPEPDLGRAAELLKLGDISLDAISAHCMRHAVLASVRSPAQLSRGPRASSALINR